MGDCIACFYADGSSAVVKKGLSEGSVLGQSVGKVNELSGCLTLAPSKVQLYWRLACLQARLKVSYMKPD